MTAEHSVEIVAAARESLWLSLRLGRENWLFELAPNDEHAIVVGNWRRAHVPINRREVAPIHFHFEREGGGIRLIPGYGNDVCVNGRPVSGPCVLGPRSVIAFAGLSVEVAFFSIESGVLASLEPRRTLRAPEEAGRTRLASTCVAFPAALVSCVARPIDVRIVNAPERGMLRGLIDTARRWLGRLRRGRGMRRERPPLLA